jgi:hypothetical protein
VHPYYQGGIIKDCGANAPLDVLMKHYKTIVAKKVVGVVGGVVGGVGGGSAGATLGAAVGGKVVDGAAAVVDAVF